MKNFIWVSRRQRYFDWRNSVVTAVAKPHCGSYFLKPHQKFLLCLQLKLNTELNWSKLPQCYGPAALLFHFRATFFNESKHTTCISHSVTCLWYTCYLIPFAKHSPQFWEWVQRNEKTKASNAVNYYSCSFKHEGESLVSGPFCSPHSYISSEKFYTSIQIALLICWSQRFEPLKSARKCMRARLYGFSYYINVANFIFNGKSRNTELDPLYVVGWKSHLQICLNKTGSRCSTPAIALDNFYQTLLEPPR